MKVSLFGVGLLALTSTIGFAQAAPAPIERHAATINQRHEHQQQRIAQGIHTGRLNARKAVRLERREASIGRLSHPDRVRLNRTSRAIYRAKHGSVRQ